jgi:hypothetical protein
MDVLGAASGPRFRIVEFSVQDDRLLLICEASDRDALSRGMQGFGVRFARAVNRARGARGKVFSDRYDDRILRTPEQVRSGLRYVLLQARKHRDWPEGEHFPCVDPLSSAPWFTGWSTRIELPSWTPSWMVPAEPPTAQARTGLLKSGWKTHGLLDPTEDPGDPPP